MPSIAAFESWPTHNPSLASLHRRIESGQIPHAMLFVGPRAETTYLTEYIESLLLCTAPEAPCGVCEACLQTAAQTHPDAYRIETEGGAGSVKTAQVEAVQEKLALKSHTGGRLVYTIHGVDNMTQVAANRLLKTLEEPNAAVFAMLTATNLQRVLPTILSRCFIFSVGQADNAAPWDDLPPDESAKSEDATDGNSPADPSFAADSRAVVQWAETLLFATEETLVLADALQKIAEGIGADRALYILAAWLRDVAHFRTGATQHVKYSEYKSELERQSKRVAVDQLFRAVEIVLQARSRLKSHVALGLNLEQMSIRLREVL